MTSDIQELTNYVYSLISKRILQRKKQLKKHLFQISNGNEKLLSNIMHNRRIKSRNPYLLNSQIIYDVVNNLNFSSSYELIWGTGEELSRILMKLFNVGIKLLTESNNGELVEEGRYEYLPYTRIAAEYNQSKFSNIDLLDVAEQGNAANRYLYFELADKWKEQHHLFFKNKGTKKLDKQLISFIDSSLPSLLQDFINESNNKGKKAYDLMTSVIEYEDAYEFEQEIHGPEYFFHQPLSNTEKTVTDIHNEVAEAGRKYIDTIVNEQKELDPYFEDDPFSGLASN